jgi:flagellar biogenesis protein FliO
MRQLAQRFAETSGDAEKEGSSGASNTAGNPGASQASGTTPANAANDRGPDEPLGASDGGAGNGQALNQQFPQRQKKLGGAAATQPGASLTSGGDGNWFLQTLAALGVVIGLIFLTRWGWMKMSGQASANTTGSRTVEVLSRTAVAPKNHVLLLRVGQRVLVVGDSAQGLRTLTELDDPDEVAEVLTEVSAQQEHSVTNNFRQMMSRVSGQFDERQWTREQGGDESEHLLDRSRAEVSSLMSRVRAMANRGASP